MLQLFALVLFQKAILCEKEGSMNKVKILVKGITAGIASFGCLYPSFDSSTRSAVNTPAPEVGLKAAFSDVAKAFGVASDCIQKGIDRVSK